MNRRRVVFFVILQVAAVLLLTEVVLRLIGPRIPALRQLLVLSASVEQIDGCDTLEELMETSIIGFRPFTSEYGFVLNSRSLRTKEYTETKPEGIYRILVIGDSFTWASGGLPHRDHWPTILEGELNDGGGQPVEVLRLGVPATGPTFQLRLWQLEGSKLQPDTVVVAFFVGNDFLDHQSGFSDLDLRSPGWRNRLAATSSLVRLAINLRRALRAVYDGGRNPGGISAVVDGEAGRRAGGTVITGYELDPRPTRPKLEPGVFIDIEERRMTLCHESKRAVFEELLVLSSATLLRFRDEVEATGARFMVVLVPDEYQVSPTVAGEILRRNGRSAVEYDLELPQRRLTEVLADEGVEVLDLLPAFRSRGPAVQLYGVRDTHWNQEGNRLAAATLAERLQTHH